MDAVRRKQDTKIIPATVVVAVKDDGSDGFTWGTWMGPGPGHEERAKRQVAALATFGLKARAVPIWKELPLTPRELREKG